MASVPRLFPLPLPMLEEYVEYTGEVTNRPAWTVDGRSASVTAPTCVHWVPSAES